MAATVRPNHRTTAQLSAPRRETARTVTDCILESAERHPDRAALVIAGPLGQRIVSYGELGERVHEVAAGFDAGGIPSGARVLVMAAPSLDFYMLALGVMASGRVLVVVDGRMRRRRIVHALNAAAPDVVIAPPAVMRWWPLLSSMRRARRFTIDGRMPGAPSAATLRGASAAIVRAASTSDAPAIVAFSSGSSGAAKQIVRSHDVLLAQHRALAGAFPAPDGDVNLPGFPMAVLHNLCCGTTSVLPDAELRAAMTSDASLAIRLMERCGVTSLSAAPAFARAIARRGIGDAAPIAGVAHVVVGGGPVSRTLAAELVAAFPNAQASIVYGATEAEPIATASLREALVSRGEGFLVGRPVPDVEIVLDRSRHDAGAGEVLVRGRHVVRATDATDGWHRTGDVARIDAHGRLWLLGRVSEAVNHGDRVVLPGAVEAIALAMRGVDAAGFVAHAGAPEGELAIELATPSDATVLVARLSDELARRGFGTIPVRVVAHMPMDARHESKVLRGELVRLLARSAR
jgi:acyl-CoA synthetase (AMP-forming)/AMP-acid ligase II